jgi:hypothetical protein
MTDYWFKPHTYGFGATPANWKGWAATGVFALVMAAVTLLLEKWIISVGRPTTWPIVVAFVAVLILTAGFIALAWAKTDGQWRWRWGK